jgi:hypothetical protein
MVKPPKRFINNKIQLLKYRFNNIMERSGLVTKLPTFISSFINIIVTGCVIYYVVHWLDNPLGYGLLIFMVTYYTKWLITLIKTPYNEIGVGKDGELN